MPFYADLHIHSKYSRACSKDCDLENLAWWARRKGIGLVGTGDFTHPAWFDHLTDMLVPAEAGVFALRPDVDREVLSRLPGTCQDPVRFMLSVEISTIYKRDDATRKVHHLVYVPDFEAAREFNRRLGRIGNLGSDGRPILGLDSRDLLEICLESGAGSYLVPAHIWTPWFAVLGSKSGFDAVEDCYADLADHVFALETGLSSDPAMNWRLSALDRYRLVSNSDAHSPPVLSREATVFDTELDYFAVRRALETGEGFGGSIEFFPEEGKYHLDGHRKCEVRLEPAETRDRHGRCPSCGKPLTVGVLHRVEELADRPEGTRPPGAAGFRSLVPLPEIMSEILGVGPRSKAVLGEIASLVARLGPELAILDQLPIGAIEAARAPVLAEAIDRLRRGQVIRDAGYDGEYGVIKLFDPGELRQLAGEPGLFETPAPLAPRRRQPAAALDEGHPAPIRAEQGAPHPIGPGLHPRPHHDGSLLGGLDEDQRSAAEVIAGPLLIIAGPGTGKTRTVTHRIAHLVTEHGVPPEQCLAITFTRRACAEMQERLAALVPDRAHRLTVTTFHGLGVRILREQHDRLGLSASFRIADEAERLAVLRDLASSEREARRLLGELSRRRAADAPEADLEEIRGRYTKALRARDLVDFDDLIAMPVDLLGSEPGLAQRYRDTFRWISVDEYQDVDELQYRLLRLLAPTGGNLCAIGDPDQAIYSFRGADVGFFLRFRQDFPTARTVQLTRNYRSTRTILAGALQAIAPGTLVPDRSLHPVQSAGRDGAEPAGIGLHEAATAEDEAAFVTRTIDLLLGGQSFHSLDSGRVDSADGLASLSLSDIAVLYRTDAQAGPVMEALTRAGLPFQKRSHDRLADRPGVQAVVRDLRYRSTAAQVSPSVPARLHEAAESALALLPVSRGQAEAAEQRREIHAAVDLLAPLAERCAGDVSRFLIELAMGAEVDTWDPRADRISLLTLHAAKGLEFPVVFIVGCEDGLLPLLWPGADDDRLGDEHVREERRLFFVGMTRARTHLYLSHARERFRRGAVRRNARSPFLAALEPGLLVREGAAPARARPQSSQLRLL